MIQKHQFTFEEQILIDNTLKKILKKQKIAYKKLIQNQQKWREDLSDIKCYIFSTNFIDDWKQFTSYDSQNLDKFQHKSETPSLMNENIKNCSLDFNEIQLTPAQIEEGQDYEVFSEGILQAFGAYPGNIIQRLCYIEDNVKKVQLHPNWIKVFFIDSDQVSKIKSANSTTFNPSVHKVFYYKSDTIQTLIQRLTKYAHSVQKLLEATQQRLWVARQNIDLQKQFINFKKNNLTMFEAPGDQISIYSKLSDLKINGKTISLEGKCKDKYVYTKASISNYEVASYSSYNNKKIDIAPQPQPQPQPAHSYNPPAVPAHHSAAYPHAQSYSPANPAGYKKNTNEKRCEHCRKQKKSLPFQCICKKFAYCSEQCQTRGYKYHACKERIDVQTKNVYEKLHFDLGNKSSRGIVGLQNVGNTCFMNSALQCLSNTTQLTEYFLKNHYYKELNTNNPIGAEGKIAYMYAKFIRQMWCGMSSIVCPISLKNVCGLFQPMFAGNEQHDSQEFLMFLVDSLHEDLNRVKKKEMTDQIDHKGKSDLQIAKESWIQYLRRNQSIITDLMVGQLKSLVICPNCNIHSNTFDSYITLPIPVPQEQVMQLSFYFFYNNFREETKKITAYCINNTIQQLEDHIYRITKINRQRFKLYITGFNGMVNLIGPTDTIKKIIACKNVTQSKVQQKQLFCQQFGEQQIKTKDTKYLIFKIINDNNNRVAISFKRIFPFKVDQDLLGQHLYDRIYRYLAKSSCTSNSNNSSIDEQTINKRYHETRKLAQKGEFIRIYMKWGNMKVNKNKVQFQMREQIKENTKVWQMMQGKSQQEVQFEVTIPYEAKLLNSFRTHQEPQGKKSNKLATYSLQDCFKYFTMAEILQNDNQWYCPRCKEFQNAQKQLQIYKTPKILIIQLKRFKQTTNGKSKNDSIVNFPQQLDISKYLINHQLPQAYFQTIKQPYIKPVYQDTDQTNKSKSTKYDLFGMINHYGSINGGHYMAFALNNKEWYRFNDSSVDKVTLSQSSKENSYILFYRRKE